jgi:maleylacetate reductase
MTVAVGEFAVQAHERIVFGHPAADAVREEARRAGARRVFIVSNRSLARREDGALQRLVRSLGPLHAGTFAAMSAHSPGTDVIAAVDAARAADADLLVALGGGSVIDGTKVAQLCLWRGVTAAEQLERVAAGVQAAAAAPADAIRAVAVPTTFSAAEFTSTAAFNDEATRTKRVVSHRLLAPRAILLDPEATLDAPLRLLLATGVRAVDHAVETFCSPSAHAGIEALSVQGLNLLAGALPAIADDPRHLESRQQAQLGTWQAVAPVAAGVSVGASHGIGYVLGGTYGVPHGDTSCVLLPAVLRWNAEVDAARQRELARQVGAPGDDLPEFIAALIARLGLPASLRDVGIARHDLDDIATRAVAYPAVAANPRPIRTASDVRQILDLAW